MSTSTRSFNEHYTTDYRYGEEVEHYLEVFLATPGISQEQISRALIGRGSARRKAADKLLTRAYEGMINQRDGGRQMY